MKWSIILLLPGLLFVSCQNSKNETTGLKRQNASLQEQNRLLQKQIDSLKALHTEAPDTVGQAPKKTERAPAGQAKAPALRTGKHDFTLQWISWDQPGSVDIQPADEGWYSIKGAQKSKRNSDYITINGLIKPISDKELLFKGEIESVVETNNGGKPCIKEGSRIFKSTKNRQYWRLQDMINCEGGQLTDYVDIYF